MSEGWIALLVLLAGLAFAGLIVWGDALDERADERWWADFRRRTGI